MSAFPLLLLFLPMDGATEQAALDAGKLGALLEKTEAASGFLRGNLEFTAYGELGGDMVRKVHMAYEFALAGDKQVVHALNLIYDGSHPHRLFCKNEKGYFSLAKRGAEWALINLQPLDRLSENRKALFAAFAGHFDSTYLVSDKRLRELLIDPDYRVVISRVGPRLIGVTGRRAEQSADGLLQFDAMIVVSDDGSSAMIGESNAHWKQGERRLERSSLNRIRQTGQALRLEESIERITNPNDPTEEQEVVRKFQLQETPSTGADAAFCFSTYGLPEPEFADAPPVAAPERFGWFFMLLLAGVTLLVLGRHVRQTVEDTKDVQSKAKT